MTTQLRAQGRRDAAVLVMDAGVDILVFDKGMWHLRITLRNNYRFFIHSLEVLKWNVLDKAPRPLRFKQAHELLTGCVERLPSK